LTEDGEEEVEEEPEEDTLGYLMAPPPPWLFDLSEGVTPLLQVGLSAPVWRRKHRRTSHFFQTKRRMLMVQVLCGACVPPASRCALLSAWRGLRLGEPG